jgi:hypothetical protein
MLQLIHPIKFTASDIIVFASLGTKASIRPAVTFVYFIVACALKGLHTPDL